MGASLLAFARTDASRLSGAKSRAPVGAASKAESRKNALRHGRRAAVIGILPDKDAAA